MHLLLGRDIQMEHSSMIALLPLLLACTGSDGPKAGDSTADTDPSSLARPSVVINEFLAVNDTIIADNAGEYDDWVEIYNTGTEVVQFDGLYLSDDIEEPLKFALPVGQGIDPGGYALFWADDDDGEGDSGAPSQGDHHLGFKLSSIGEDLVLTFAVGGDSVTVDAIEYGSQTADISAARVPDGDETETMQYGTPTPNATNGG